MAHNPYRCMDYVCFPFARELVWAGKACEVRPPTSASTGFGSAGADPSVTQTAGPDWVLCSPTAKGNRWNCVGSELDCAEKKK